MMRWKHVEGLSCNVEIVHSQSHIKAYVGLRKHHTLAFTRCSRGKYDRCKLCGVDLIFIIRIVATAVKLSTLFLKGSDRSQRLSAKFGLLYCTLRSD